MKPGTFHRKIGIVAWAILHAANATAALYVVDPKHPHAQDTNPGTPEKPWKTLHQASQTVLAGDTVFVMAGAYDERIAPKNSGAEGKRITFKSVPLRAASIKGADTARCHDLTIQGFTIADTDFGIRIDSDRVEILDNYFEAIRRYPIIGKGESVRIAFNEIYHCQFGIVTGGSHWTVENNEVRRLFNYGTLGDCDYCRPFGERHVFRGNFFHGTKKEEIGSAHVDCFQVFDVNGERAGHTTIENNVGLDFHQAFMAEGKYHPGNIGDFTFRRNIFASPSMGAWGLCVVEVPRVRAINNTFARIFYHGMGFTGERANDGLARNNIFAQLRTSYWADKTTCAGDHNLIFECPASQTKGSNDWVNVDPQFAESAKLNFRLKAGSPAIKSGADAADRGALEHPNVYYVDPRHPGASDEGFGYPGWPLQTLAAACRAAGPGEAIVLRGGTYHEPLAVIRSNVTVRALTGEKVILSGADPIVGWERNGANWSAPFKTIPKQLLVDGSSWTNFTFSPAAQRITIRGIVDPRLHEVEAVVREHAIDCAGLSNVRVEGATLANTFGAPVVGRPVLWNVRFNSVTLDSAP